MKKPLFAPHHRRASRRLVRNTILLFVLGAAFIVAAAGRAADLYVAIGGSQIYKYTPPNFDGVFTNSLNNPGGLAIDAAGNIYVDDGSNNIYKFTPSGTRSTFASGLSNPLGLAFDRGGNLYEADERSGNIYKFAPDGSKTTFASGLGGVLGLAFDSKGNLYATLDNISGVTLYKIAPDGTKTAFASPICPFAVAVDSADNVYISEGTNGCFIGGTKAPIDIRKYAPDGSSTVFTSSVANPRFLTFDPAGNLYVGDDSNGFSGQAAILVFSPSGTRTVFSSGLFTPSGLAFAPMGATPTPTPTATPAPSPTPTTTAVGDVFVADNGGQKIYQYTPPNLDGIFSNAVSFPVGLAIDTAGNVYEADNGSATVSKFTPAGVKSTFASGFVGPTGLALDKAGDLFVADNGASGATSATIVKITPSGVKSTFATGLQLPTGLAFDSAGNLYVANNGREGYILKFTPAGVQSVFASGIAGGGLAFDSADNLYAACGICNGILKFAPNGSRSAFTTNLSNPQYVAFDASGNLYVTDAGDGSGGAVFVFTPAAVRSTLSSGLNTPRGVAIVPGAPAAAQLQNIATRLNVLTGDNVLIGGFIPTGTAPKKVVIRGIGPSLTAFGITNALADPVLELHGPDGATIATNDNWRSDANQASQIQAAGLAPKNDLEAALVATLDPGKGYTAIVSGQNGGTGIGLAEVYDIDPAAASKLGNIATRGFVDKGDNIMIGGLIVGPASGSSTKVVVRGIGPSLTAAGVNGALQDPTLELHDSNGTTIASNDNWQTDANASQVQAAGLAPKNPNESAIYMVLPPAAYTAVLRGNNDTIGVGLVEVYNVQ